MIKYVQTAQRFDAAAMQREVALLEEKAWKQHYNKRHYEGSWSVMPLRSVQGSIENIISMHGGSADHYQDTPLLQNCPYIQSVLNFFACDKTSVRLMKLHAAAVIKEHRDYAMNFEEGEARFHIPVTTSQLVDFFLDDEKIPMQEGECWYLNLSLKHRVQNGGTTDRVHLVVDCIVNDWVKHLLNDRAAVQKNIAEEKGQLYNREDQLKIIAQLRQMNTPTATALATQMENDIHTSR